MAKYRKKPVEVEVFRFYIDPMPDWFMDRVTSNDIGLINCNYDKYGINEAKCIISVRGHTTIANGGDYIIKDEKGGIYPFDPVIFNATYEKAE